MSSDPIPYDADRPSGYVPPISFEELHAAGRIVLPGADVEADGYGPLGDPSELTIQSTDPLEAFVDAWAHAGQTPTDPLLP